MIDFSKLLDHPDKDEIISKLVTGISPKNISDWLRVKYSDKEQQHLRLSSKLLKDFIDNNLDLYNTLRNDLADTKAGKQIARETSKSLLNNKTYQERLNEVADQEIDIKRSITDTLFLIKARIEQVWDKVQENPGNLKPDYALIKWFELLLNAQEKWNKLNEVPEAGVINQNITINMIEQHSAILQEAIRETLAEMDSDISFKFMDKLNDKLNALKAPIEKEITQEQKLNEIKVLKAKIESEANDE